MQYYCEKYRLDEKSFSNEAQSALISYSWPGNIRELSHIIERSIFIAQQDVVELSDLGIMGNPTESFDFEQATLDEIEAYVIEQRLTKYQHKVQETIDSLGLSRSAYYRRVEKHQL